MPLRVCPNNNNNNLAMYKQTPHVFNENRMYVRKHKHFNHPN